MIHEQVLGPQVTLLSLQSSATRTIHCQRVFCCGFCLVQPTDILLRKLCFGSDVLLGLPSGRIVINGRGAKAPSKILLSRELRFDIAPRSARHAIRIRAVRAPTVGCARLNERRRTQPSIYCPPVVSRSTQSNNWIHTVKTKRTRDDVPSEHGTATGTDGFADLIKLGTPMLKVTGVSWPVDLGASALEVISACRS